MRTLFSLISFFCLSFAPLVGAIVQINGKWCDDRYAPQYSVTEHFNLGKEHFQKEEWKEANQNFLVITHHFPESPFHGEALYYSGVCFYHLKDYDLANKQLSSYLNAGVALQFFEKAFDYKYEIALAFADGARRHLFGFERMPKWLPSRKQAIEIYDEISGALPSREIALKALFSKANLLSEMRDYKESIDTFLVIVRRFPKHDLSAESYLLISDIYLEQAKLEPQNPDFISLAKINLQRFQKSFPSESRLDKASSNLLEMKEVCAGSLYDVAQFYERKKKPKASLVYYNEAVKRYPETVGAKKSLAKIQSLNKKGLS